ncbi:hypothetical protein Tlie_0689 [Thermovirga lienii DSM 17291]|uniref:Putative Se/S carrier protein-like domain-containing protein n=1 Tax=Thermovirga lienii (strain ATCC BAA-1197 / DSM 17291 / Cas60314) TaxID=580340 RepID=G7V955_THELD|nr:DUF3343 domain-containing protein [Thermovirga lienii]AER66424.1 hypothetical protein Tlie_0689 [Thermovirga lienii DSM 17291]
MQCIATFETTHMAILFERSFRKEGLSVKIVPVPRSISSSCGLACRFPCDQKDYIVKTCKEKGIEIQSFHEIE